MRREAVGSVHCGAYVRGSLLASQLGAAAPKSLLLLKIACLEPAQYEGRLHVVHGADVVHPVITLGLRVDGEVDAVEHLGKDELFVLSSSKKKRK